MMTQTMSGNKASMPTARRGFGIVLIGQSIYVIGGGNGSLLSTNEVYDIASDTWSTKAGMPTLRQYTMAATLNGIIYVIGGATSNSGATNFTTNEAYNPALNACIPARYADSKK